jgi:POT family proton-dependent oligopeptide transporter
MAMTPATSGTDTRFFGHPKGLQTLFFTEMWERFSYYGMRAFLMLFMVAPTENGGLGIDAPTAGLIYALYTSAVYVLSVPGGWIADRFLGQQRAVFIGGVFIMVGHLVLAMPSGGTFYLGLGLVAIGTGFLKPNISTMVGQLYGKDDIRRDAGFSIYYMGINIGAFAAPFICGGFLAEGKMIRGFLDSMGVSPNNAWHLAFAAAAVGMLIGLIQYNVGRAHLGDAGKHPVPAKNPSEASLNKKILVGVVSFFLLLPALLATVHYTGVMILTADGIKTGTSIFYGIMSVAVFSALYFIGAENRDERNRVLVMLVLFLCAIVFFACFEQAGSVLTLFASENTDRNVFGWEFPASVYQSCNSVFVILFAPVFAWLWLHLAKKGTEPVPTMKFAIGVILVGVGCAIMIIPGANAVAGKLSGPWWLVGIFLVHTFGELCLSPVGLSSMSRLAPERWGGLVLGVWFLGSAIGNFLSGLAVGWSESMPKDQFFTMMAGIPIGLGLLLAVFAKRIFGIIKQSPATSSGH